MFHQRNSELFIFSILHDTNKNSRAVSHILGIIPSEMPTKFVLQNGIYYLTYTYPQLNVVMFYNENLLTQF